MNLLRKSIILFAAIVGMSVSSCSNFDELNTDPNLLDNVNPGTLLNPILYNMSVYNWNRSDGYTMDLMQVSVPTNSLGGVSRYFMSEAAGDGTWSTYYRWLANIRQMEQMAIDLNEPNYRAVALTLKSWIYQLVVDAFGDVPMSEACRGEEGLYFPKFDTQEDIYRMILADLDTASAIYNIKVGLRYNKEGELLYGTTDLLTSSKSPGITKWLKFNNSLRLRVLNRVKDVFPDAKQRLAEVLGDTKTWPIFESNDDAALLKLSGVFPQELPMNRPQDFTSYRAVASFFIDNLNQWSDPRRAKFCTTVFDSVANKNVYKGLPSGYAALPAYAASNMNQNLAKAPLQVVIMPYAEVEFIKAELAQKGLVAGIDATTAYNNGVAAAITQWGAVVPDGFFDKAGVKYDGTFEQIMLQKFYALFFCDYQMWYEYNRTGLPVLPRGDGIPTGNEMPRRFMYPAKLQRTNGANYAAAIEKMGGDNFAIKLFWQK